MARKRDTSKTLIPLLEAAKRVVARWEHGDLAEAVGELDTAVKEFEPIRVCAFLEGGILQGALSNFPVTLDVVDYDKDMPDDEKRELEAHRFRVQGQLHIDAKWEKRDEREDLADIKRRLEYLRRELKKERISYGEIAELQSLVEFIEPGDVQLLEAAGVPEHAGGDA